MENHDQEHRCYNILWIMLCFFCYFFRFSSRFNIDKFFSQSNILININKKSQKFSYIFEAVVQKCFLE